MLNTFNCDTNTTHHFILIFLLFARSNRRLIIDRRLHFSTLSAQSVILYTPPPPCTFHLINTSIARHPTNINTGTSSAAPPLAQSLRLASFAPALV
jgi:hypothetical protein